MLVAVLVAFDRMLDARFGRALIGIRENEARMESLGYPTFRFRLAAFAIAGGVAGLAGALFANHNLFVSPSVLHWTQSATFVVMVILGGIGYRYGGVAGRARAAAARGDPRRVHRVLAPAARRAAARRRLPRAARTVRAGSNGGRPDDPARASAA